MGLTLKVSDIDIKEVISDLAKIFKADLEIDVNEFCVRIPKKMGSGFIKGAHFENGLGVLEFDFLLKQKFVLEYKKGIVHPLKLLFNRESTITHKFEEEDEVNEIHRFENAILSSTPQNNHIFSFPKNEPICIYSLEINRKLFEQKISEFLEDMHEDLMALFRDVNGTRIFFHKAHYSLDIGEFLEEFTECELIDFMKMVYKEGKAYEILSHQLQQYLDDLNGEGKRKILRKAAVAKVEMAAEIIRDELDRMDNIVTLAKRVGLNQNTLQQGFKRLFKASVNEYVRNLRIERAKELLETTDLNVTEISYRIGINSRSYFSKLFKEKYGISPKDYHNQMRKADR